MTRDEAIKFAKENILVYTSEMAEFKALAIDAIEKQIPKKPIKWTKIATLNKSPVAISWESTYCCPRCKSNLVSQYKYCPQCGLEIDWEDEE